MLVGSTLIATSGYSYDDWKGSFYPEDLPKSEYLRYYSLFFPFVELNFSYYAMPEAHALKAMAERTPNSFLFSIKAHKSLTHEISPGWMDDSARFCKAVDALASRNRLAAVLIQLPYSFRYEAQNRSYLGKLLDQLQAFPLAVEFRNDQWSGQRVYDELDKRGVGWVMVDRPDVSGLPRQEERVTGGLGYVRFHGRNADAWWNGDNVSRYDYLYSKDELTASASRIKRMAKSATTLLVAFNNHAGGKAAANASQLKELVS